MTERRVYDRALLDEVLARDGAVLVGEYEKGGRRTLLTYRCKCGNERTKTFALIVSASAICVDCTNKKKLSLLDKGRTIECRQKRIQTMGNPYDYNKIYNYKSLEECILKDSAKLQGEYKLLYGHTMIHFVCNCGKEHQNTFEKILGRTAELREKNYCGALCDNCNKKRWIKQRETTNLNRYGKIGGINITAETKKKSIDTSINKYGVPSPNMSDIVKQKKARACLEKYGVENPAQSPEIQEKTQRNAKKYKEYKMPSGQIRKVQGYEPFALDALLKIYTEEQIMTDRKDVPHICYQVDGKKRVYFPDIFISHINTIVEVKSTWTYKCKSDNVDLKKKATEEKGYVYELWCFDGKGNRVDI